MVCVREGECTASGGKQQEPPLHCLEALAPEGRHSPRPTAGEDEQRAGSEPSSRGAAAAANSLQERVATYGLWKQRTQGHHANASRSLRMHTISYCYPVPITSCLCACSVHTRLSFHVAQQELNQLAAGPRQGQL